MTAAIYQCTHETTEDVALVTGEVVAKLCVHCLDRLPREWGCTDCEWAEISRPFDTSPTRHLARCCISHGA